MAKQQRSRRRQTPPTVIVIRQALVLVAVIALFGATVVAFKSRIFRPNEEPRFHNLGSDVMNARGFGERCGPPRSQPFEVTFVHSPDKQRWLEDAAGKFMRRCPNTQVRLIALDDIEAAKQIAAGVLTPTSWAPSDSLLLHYLDARAGHHVEVEDRGSLLRSPMVMLAWTDRLALLDQLLPAGATGAGAWAGSACAGVAFAPTTAATQAEPLTWASWWRDHHNAPTLLPSSPTLAELEGWGAVRIRHASPAQSTTGFLGLYLIAHDFLTGEAGAPLGREQLATALEREQLDLERWLRRCEARQEPPSQSGALLTEALFNLGPEHLDAVITDEHLALAALARLEGREQELREARMIYPQVSVVRDHPELHFPNADSGDLAAALRFGDYLRDAEVQAHALELGFRPTNPALALRDYDQGPNPFTRLRRYGAELTPTLREPPRLDGASVAALIELWADATGRS